MQLYIGNLAPDVDEQLLLELIQHIAPVASLRLPRNKTTRKHQGYGFATFANARDAEYAHTVLTAAPVKLFGRQLKVNPAAGTSSGTNPAGANSRSGPRAGSPSTVAQDGGIELFVGNLDPELVDEQALAAPFSRFGRVVQARVARDASGAPRGHGFVTLESAAAAEKAIEALNGQYLMNRVSRVEHAR